MRTQTVRVLSSLKVSGEGDDHAHLELALVEVYSVWYVCCVCVFVCDVICVCCV